MKKFITLVATAAIAMPLWAEGYQVNTLSAKQNGMGHTGTALKLGAESMIFNPAGLGYMDKTFDLSGSFTAIFPTATATLPNGSKYTTDNDPSTPIGIGAAFSIYDNLKAGITFYTPYGSGINWTENWAGAVLNQKVKLATYTVQPTISWRITPKLSVGAGLMLTWGSVDLDKGLVSPSSMDMMLAYQGIGYSFGDITPASVNLKGTSNVSFGVNVGAMYDISKKVTVGASFRSKMGMKVGAGDAHVRYANEIAQQALQSTLDLINDANFSAEMPCPYVLNIGVSYKPIEKLTLAFDAQLTGWNTYKTLNIDFAGDKLDAFDQSLTKNYSNSWTYHLGAQYTLTDRFDVRAGMMLDTTPCNTDYYNPETPGMTKIEPSVGFSFRPFSGFSIDLACLYIAGTGVKGATGQYDDFIMKRLTGQSEYLQTFTADYNVHAVIPSIGVSYSF
jgi:long-chain fatty acid transport protein